MSFLAQHPVLRLVASPQHLLRTLSLTAERQKQIPINNLARAVDQPIGAMLTDLERRGLLDETLVVFGTEFGRTPGSQGSDGRDHHIFGFSVWMAGGGLKRGIVHGAAEGTNWVRSVIATFASTKPS